MDPLHASDQAHAVLQQYWGYDAFRPMQEDVVLSVMKGKDTLALMPTGGGKSLCYQVPALCQEGTCLVISPLIALMKDQVEGLRKRNITAFAIYSGMSRREVINTLTVVAESNCKFLYVSPERLETSLFREYLPALGISLIAVDEAHCISQWGYDFRPPYLRIARLREELPGVPVLALTASATPEVQTDICRRLDTDPSADVGNTWAVFRQSFERPNLSYSVFSVESKINKILDIFQKVPGTGIVYCKSRRRTKEISDLLRMHQVAADYYHAGLPQEERNRKQEAWIKNEIRVIVCTNAFGMGIDKPDVRTVVHADVPDCLENYYQEAGRAGRDRQRAYAVLLYDQAALRELEKLPDLRFPDIDTIRQVYEALCNHLQLPVSGGAGESHDFDMSAFARHFTLEPSTALHALKALEQEGWFTFNEQVFLPATVQFNCTKQHLYQFEQDYPHLDPLIKTLLRTYEGIFDFSCFISESLLARLLRIEEQKVAQLLTELHHRHILIYTPRKDKPQLYVLRNRIPIREFSINKKNYEERKERLRLRVQQMIGYVEDRSTCRSQITAGYFGDNTTRPCGICDNCLQQKQQHFNAGEFDRLKEQILQRLTSQQPLPVKLLLDAYTGQQRDKAWKITEFLLDEEILQQDDQGRLLLGRSSPANGK